MIFEVDYGSGRVEHFAQGTDRHIDVDEVVKSLTMKLKMFGGLPPTAGVYVWVSRALDDGDAAGRQKETETLLNELFEAVGDDASDGDAGRVPTDAFVAAVRWRLAVTDMKNPGRLRTLTREDALAMLATAAPATKAVAPLSLRLKGRTEAIFPIDPSGARDDDAGFFRDGSHRAQFMDDDCLRAAVGFVESSTYTIHVRDSAALPDFYGARRRPVHSEPDYEALRERIAREARLHNSELDESSYQVRERLTYAKFVGLAATRASTEIGPLEIWTRAAVSPGMPLVRIQEPGKQRLFKGHASTLAGMDADAIGKWLDEPVAAADGAHHVTFFFVLSGSNGGVHCTYVLHESMRYALKVKVAGAHKLDTANANWYAERINDLLPPDAPAVSASDIEMRNTTVYCHAQFPSRSLAYGAARELVEGDFRDYFEMLSGPPETDILHLRYKKIKNYHGASSVVDTLNIVIKARPNTWVSYKVSGLRGRDFRNSFASLNRKVLKLLDRLAVGRRPAHRAAAQDDDGGGGSSDSDDSFYGAEEEDDDAEEGEERREERREERSAGEEEEGRQGEASADSVLNALKAADARLFAKRGYSTHCQRSSFKQPVVISRAEEQRLAPDAASSVRHYGSTPQLAAKNAYICPAVWCPQSRTALSFEEYFRRPLKILRNKNKKITYSRCPGDHEVPYSTVLKTPDTDIRAMKDADAATIRALNEKMTSIGSVANKRSSDGFCLPCCQKKPKADSCNANFHNQAVDPNPREAAEAVYVHKEWVVDLQGGGATTERYGRLAPEIAALFSTDDLYVRAGASDGAGSKSSFMRAVARILDTDPADLLARVAKEFEGSAGLVKFLNLERGKVLRTMLACSADATTSPPPPREFAKWCDDIFGSSATPKLCRMVHCAYVYFHKFFLRNHPDTFRHDVMLDVMNTAFEHVNPRKVHFVMLSKDEHGYIHCPVTRNVQDFVSEHQPFAFVFLWRAAKVYQPVVRVTEAASRAKMRPVAVFGADEVSAAATYLSMCKSSDVDNPNQYHLVTYLVSLGYEVRHYVVDYTFAAIGLVVAAAEARGGGVFYLPLPHHGIDIVRMGVQKFLLYTDASLRTVRHASLSPSIVGDLAAVGLAVATPPAGRRRIGSSFDADYFLHTADDRGASAGAHAWWEQNEIFDGAVAEVEAELASKLDARARKEARFLLAPSNPFPSDYRKQRLASLILRSDLAAQQLRSAPIEKIVDAMFVAQQQTSDPRIRHSIAPRDGEVVFADAAELQRHTQMWVDPYAIIYDKLVAAEEMILGLDGRAPPPKDFFGYVARDLVSVAEIQRGRMRPSRIPRERGGAPLFCYAPRSLFDYLRHVAAYMGLIAGRYSGVDSGEVFEKFMRFSDPALTRRALEEAAAAGGRGDELLGRAARALGVRLAVWDDDDAGGRRHVVRAGTRPYAIVLEASKDDGLLVVVREQATGKLVRPLNLDEIPSFAK